MNTEEKAVSGFLPPTTMPEKDTRTRNSRFIDARNPVYASDKGNVITIEVLPAGYEADGYARFTSASYDPEPDGAEFFREIVAGKFGPVAPYVYTQEMATRDAEREKQRRLNAATGKISLWQTKLLMGRHLTDDESAQLNAWMDYIDAVTAVDTSKAPDITWPDKPE